MTFQRFHPVLGGCAQHRFKSLAGSAARSRCIHMFYKPIVQLIDRPTSEWCTSHVRVPCETDIQRACCHPSCLQMPKAIRSRHSYDCLSQVQPAMLAGSKGTLAVAASFEVGQKRHSAVEAALLLWRRQAPNDWIANYQYELNARWHGKESKLAQLPETSSAHSYPPRRCGHYRRFLSRKYSAAAHVSVF